MITATIFNHAGGAGKTSITRNVGYQFAQANLSSWLSVRNVSIDATVYDLATTGAPLPEPVEAHGPHVIPSQVDLALAETGMLGVPGPQPGRMRVGQNLDSTLANFGEQTTSSHPGRPER